MKPGLRIRSFGTKLILLVTLTTGTAVLTVATILAVIGYLDADRQFHALADAQLSIIAANSEAPLVFGDPELGKEVLDALHDSYNVASASLFKSDGTLFASYRSPDTEPPALWPGPPGRRVLDRWLVVTRSIQGPAGEVGRLQVIFDRSGAMQRSWSIAAGVFAIALVTVALAFFVARRIRAFLIRPIDQLAATARTVSATRDYSVRAVRHADDELGEFTDVFNDMLEQIGRKNLEIQRAHDQRAALLESERNARAEAERASQLKDEFVATLSHELRTPLSAILGWARMMRERDIGSDQLAKGLEVIERNARAQTQIIEDLLDVSRIVAGQIRLDVQTVNLAEVVESALATVRPAADAKGIRLVTVIDQRVGPVRGDPSRLQQVVWNLLSNAIKFTERGGRVQVAVERVNSHVELTVSDTGQGIRPEFLPHVFDRFRQADGSTTRRHTGLGLGLSIVKELTEVHGGRVRARSGGEGQGSTFSVELPLMVVHGGVDAERVHPRVPQARTTPVDETALDGLAILVVDDEPDARDLVRTVLQRHGAAVSTAGSAREALEAYRTMRPQVLVSDIGMPDQDGYDLIRCVRELERELDRNTPAIALTAFARPEDRTRALRAGFQMHLSKPVEPAELLAAIASLAGLARTARG